VNGPYNKPIPWLIDKVLAMDEAKLAEKVAYLEEEVKRLQAEKADRRGPKPKT